MENMKFKKINCMFHPEQILTNFCSEQQCLLPLCPKCIEMHTREHKSLQTYPNYVDLYQTMKKCQQSLQSSHLKIKQNVQRLAVYYQNNKKIIEQFKDKVFEIRNRLTNIVNTEMDKILQMLNSNIENVDSLKISCQQMNQELVEISLLKQSLYTNKAMSTLIKVQLQKLSNKIKQRDQEISKIQNYPIQLTLKYNICQNKLRQYIHSGLFIKSQIKKFTLFNLLDELKNICDRQPITENKRGESKQKMRRSGIRLCCNLKINQKIPESKKKNNFQQRGLFNNQIQLGTINSEKLTKYRRTFTRPSQLKQNLIDQS